MAEPENTGGLRVSIAELETLRARWQRYRATQAMTLDAGGQFVCGGLGRHADDLGARLMFIPSDPFADRVQLNSEVLEWLRQDRPSPYGGRPPSWGHQDRASSNVLIAYDTYRDDRSWTRYLALHRHGGIEVGLGRSQASYALRDVRAVRLRTIVAAAWAAATLQVEAIERWPIDGPFEVVLALRDTGQATLGEFAEGWRNPGEGLFEYPRCLDDHVLIRLEVEVIDDEWVAMELGDRIEQAFGTTNRRHVARTGKYEGSFDPR